MANFSFKSFGQLLQDMIDTVTANASEITNFGEGSTVRVIFEAVCGRLDYFSILLQRILKLCRLATSEGSDVDSFTNDYGMDARLSAEKGITTITLSRLTASPQTVRIPVGSTILAVDDSVTYQVIADETQAGYVAADEAYYIAADELTVDVTAEAVTAGEIGNVSANKLTVVGSALVGVDRATNPSAVTNGRDAETDSEMRARFPKYINTRARATELAIEYAIDIVKNGLIYKLYENIDTLEQEKLGNIVVIVDDGTGSPTQDLLDDVTASIDLYRGFSINVDVIAPVILTVNASCTIQVHSGYDEDAVKEDVAEAIEDFLDSREIAEFMDVDRLAAIAFGVAGVKEISSMQLNSGTTNITPSFKQIIKAGTVTVS